MANRVKAVLGAGGCVSRRSSFALLRGRVLAARTSPGPGSPCTTARLISPLSQSPSDSKRQRHRDGSCGRIANSPSAQRDAAEHRGRTAAAAAQTQRSVPCRAQVQDQPQAYSKRGERRGARAERRRAVQVQSAALPPADAACMLKLMLPLCIAAMLQPPRRALSPKAPHRRRQRLGRPVASGTARFPRCGRRAALRWGARRLPMRRALQSTAIRHRAPKGRFGCGCGGHGRTCLGRGCAARPAARQRRRAAWQRVCTARRPPPQ
jgi:hypothetical protein